MSAAAAAIRIEKVEKFPSPEYADLQKLVHAEMRLPSKEFADVVAAEAEHFARAAPFTPFQRQRFAAYDGDQFVGWSVGWVERPGEFHVSNSGVVPSHRRRGIYTALLAAVRAHVLEQGLVAIRSQHSVLNNPVIIAKLRAGFTICGLSQSSTPGTLVEMVCHLTPERDALYRRRSMAYVKPESQPAAPTAVG